jgi:predicted ATPase
MPFDFHNYFVVTGGPGAGKTSLIAELGRRGYASVEEAGRAIIRQQRAIGGTALHTANRVLFRELMLGHMIEHYERAGTIEPPIFFDRGIPGLIGYCRLIGVPVPDHIRRAADVYRYNDTVFVTPPWPEIYAQDHERRQDFAEAVRTYEVVVEGYREAVYIPVELPKASVGERADFVLEQIETRAAKRG